MLDITNLMIELKTKNRLIYNRLIKLNNIINLHKLSQYSRQIK
jgi:hypothetical protein